MGTELLYPFRPAVKYPSVPKRVVGRKIVTDPIGTPIQTVKAWLVRFTYDHYCQGYEEAQETLLVYAKSYPEACIKVTQGHAITGRSWQGAREFINLTLE